VHGGEEDRGLRARRGGMRAWVVRVLWVVYVNWRCASVSHSFFLVQLCACADEQRRRGKR
jgi:hypothetical protein